jgi:hypothetical protein
MMGLLANFALAVLLLVGSAFGTTHYVSKGIGLDTRTSTQAQSKTVVAPAQVKHISCGAGPCVTPTFSPVATSGVCKRRTVLRRLPVAKSRRVQERRSSECHRLLVQTLRVIVSIAEKTPCWYVPGGAT